MPKTRFRKSAKILKRSKTTVSLRKLIQEAKKGYRAGQNAAAVSKFIAALVPFLIASGALYVSAKSYKKALSK